MNSISLCVCIALENYFDKIVLNPSKGYYIKREDEISRWLLASAKKLEVMESNSVVKIIMN